MSMNDQENVEDIRDALLSLIAGSCNGSLDSGMQQLAKELFDFCSSEVVGRREEDE